MTAAVVDLNGRDLVPDPRAVLADLAAAGIRVHAVSATRRNLVQDVARYAPDVVICVDPFPGEELFEATQDIAQATPCPILLFTQDADAARMARGLASGIQGYVVNGYGAARLHALVQLTMARFKREQELLRPAANATNQSNSPVPPRVVHSARFTDALNRAGQLRMLSQRLVKLQALRLTPLAAQEAQAAEISKAYEQSVQRIEGNLLVLQNGLPRASFGSLLDSVQAEWGQMARVLAEPVNTEQVIALNRQAQRLLEQAERLTHSLEHAGAAQPLHVLNVAARQRMLSQRLAKLALLLALGDAAPASTRSDLAATREAFEQAMRYLEHIPLSSAAIRRELQAAMQHWRTLDMTVGRLDDPVMLTQLANASEQLLQALERLVDELQKGMQLLAG